VTTTFAKLMSITEAAEIADVSDDTIKRRIADGSLPALKVANRWKIRADDLQRFLEGEDPAPRAPSLPAELTESDPVAEMAERIGLSPRVAALRPDLVDRFEVVPAGEHFDRFCRTFCRHHQRVPDGPAPGTPLELEPFQREFFDEALEVDDDGRRVYSTAVLLIPRKNGKTTIASALALYLCSPADGEERPEVILAAGSKKQAGKLHEHATAFVSHPRYGSRELGRLFDPMQTAIRCDATDGKIERVAGDGDNNHSLDPHAVVTDELHTWKTPKQKENWKALTTAQGGREDPIVLAITTEGDGDDNELAALRDRIETSPATEREERRPGLTVFRDRESGVVVFVYAIPEKAGLDDLGAFERANPAPWRTAARIAKDLANPRNDMTTKLRLYGNKRGSGADRWISEDRWAECYLDGADPDDRLFEFIPEGSPIAIGVDAAHTRDTTAVSWSWIDVDGRCRVRCRVWTTRQDVAHHVYVPGGRLDNDLARDFIHDVLIERFRARLLFFDERYFETQAKDLSDSGMSAVEMHQGKPEMNAAWDGWYAAIHEGERPDVLHDGCLVLKAHVAAAIGVRTDRGWKVSKKPTGGTKSSLHRDKPIDALAAAVMSRFGAVEFGGVVYEDHELVIA
jgi:excisionase family DNA binding protein